jgi:hypothetical protein
MPMHDWTRVDAGIFHDFHVAWSVELRNALNEGILPSDYYALVEQHAGRRAADLIALSRTAPPGELAPLPAPTGGLAVAEAPPLVAYTMELAPSPSSRRRTVAIRHVSGHRLVAVMEIVSPANKDREEHVEQLAGKIESFLRAGVHVMLIDLFPPGSHDSQGIDALVREFHAGVDQPYDPPPTPPPCVVSYRAAQTIGIYFQPLLIGRDLPDMPLFFHWERYVNVPLEAAYCAAFRGVPAVWKDALARTNGLTRE